MKLSYRIYGEGKPVLIFHGLFGMSDNWQGFAKLLAEQGYQVITADLRNHGLSPHDDMHDYFSMASDVASLIQDLNLVQPVVIGHSMGGKMTLSLINSFSSLVGKAIVIDIAPYQYPVHHREIIDTLLSIDLTTITRRSEAEKIMNEAIDDYGTRQFLLKNLHWRTPEQMDWRFNLKTLNEQIEEVGASTWPATMVNTPILFVKGANSGYLDDARFSEIKSWYPNAQFVSIEGAGHWVHADKPKELLNEVLKFISE
ncbi:MAG: alpha/beta fold hydrolase [Bacteroidota bacterium]